jgi:hypothetical protein
MGNRRIFHPRTISIVLVLVLSILGVATLTGPIIAHAAGPALVQTASNGVTLCDNTCNVQPNNPVSSGDLLIVHTFCMAGGSIAGVSDQAGSAWTETVANSRGTIWSAFAKSTGTDTISTTWSNCNFSGSNAGAFSFEEFSGVGSIGNNAKQLGCTGGCTDTIMVTITTNNALVYEGFDVYGGGLGSCPTITNGASEITTQTLQCLNGLASAYSIGRTTYNPNRGIGVNSFSMQTSASQSTGHEVVELDPPGGAPTNLGTQTACFGNCGSPAVTLANTNSTHTVNFNQTVTLFYQFQANLNGQVLNMTTQVAKSYSNSNTLLVGVYTIPVCSVGQTPFSSVCPGLLQKSTSVTNPVKGANSVTNLAIPVSNGQWVGIAISATFNGMDINDTNTQVVMLQTAGVMPPVISVDSTFSTTAKVALYAYLTGNTITGIPPPATTGGNCAGFLDCIVPNLVFALCTNQTPTCQNSSALLWAILLAIFFSFFIWKMGANVLPGVRLPFGEIFLLMVLVWIFIMSGLQLLFVWVPLFFFFVISLFVGKKTGVYL